MRPGEFAHGPPQRQRRLSGRKCTPACGSRGTGPHPGPRSGTYRTSPHVQAERRCPPSAQQHSCTVPDRRELVPEPAPRRLSVVDPVPHKAVPVALDPRIGAGGQDHRA
jgi:hypothetical protein